MRSSIFTGLVRGVVIVGCGLMLTACNTTKATFDSTVRFFSSTSPENLYTLDGLIKEEQKLNLYTAVMYDNLQQDIARGGGEYLTSLGVLMKVPEGRQSEFGLISQSAYPVLFASDEVSPVETLATLTKEWKATPIK